MFLSVYFKLHIQEKIISDKCIPQIIVLKIPHGIRLSGTEIFIYLYELIFIFQGLTLGLKAKARSSNQIV